MSLLFESDYSKLQDRALTFEEDEGQRFFIFTRIPLPSGLYDADECDALVVIPQNYNQDGNDMFWTKPRLLRLNGVPIPATMDLGGGDSRSWRGNEYCRWSRHWSPQSKGAWRPGKDDIISIYRRIDWALRNPDAQ